MSNQHTIQRNIEILRDTLDGYDNNEISQKHRVSSLGQCLNTALSTLNRYGADLPVTGSREILFQNKAAILKAIDSIRVPKTSISSDVHNYLLKRFGDNYQHKAKEVAALWDDEVSQHFSSYNRNRQRKCILEWLSSEGYYRGDYIDAHYQSILFDALCKHLEALESKGDVEVIIDKAEVSPWSKSKVMVDFRIINEKVGLCAKRRMEIGIL